MRGSVCSPVPTSPERSLAGQPAAAVIALSDPEAARTMQHVVMTPRFRVYTNPDVVGCEIGGAVKNVIALAAGMADGLGFGDTPKAALITRGLAELTRLGVRQGGSPLTFLGLAGNGDLVVTCMSRHSRNHHVGEQLGLGRTLDEILGRDDDGRRRGEDRAGGSRAGPRLRRSRCPSASTSMRSCSQVAGPRTPSTNS